MTARIKTPPGAGVQPLIQACAKRLNAEMRFELVIAVDKAIRGCDRAAMKKLIEKCREIRGTESLIKRMEEAGCA